MKLIGRLTFSGPRVAHRTVRAVLARRRDMAANQHRPCWHVTGNGVGLIRGTVDDYTVAHLLVKQSSFNSRLDEHTCTEYGQMRRRPTMKVAL